MEQLFFIGIIVLFSVLEAVARKGRAGRQGGAEGVPLPEEPEARRPRAEPRPRPQPQSQGGTVPRSYDEDPSFDETARGDEARYRPEPAGREKTAAEPARKGGGSEGLIPADVWDEIQRMARGELPEVEKPPVPVPPPAPVPAPPRPRAPESRPAGWPQPSAPRPRPSGKAKPSGRAGASTAQTRTGKTLGRSTSQAVPVAPAPEGTDGHPVHLAHEAFGTQPSHRAATRQEGRPEAAPAAAIRKLLTSGRGPLRQAVILQEILGPPPGLRQD